MICKKCGSRDVKNWPFNLYGRRGYMIHCVRCGKEYFRSNDEFAKDLTESNGDPDFRCNGCLFSTDTRCLINTFISRHEQKEYFGSKNVKEDK